MIWRSGDRVIYALSATVGLLGAYAGACSLVNFGELPLKVSGISGTVVGNYRFEDASKPRRLLRGALVQLLSRTDQKYSKDVVVDKKVRNTLPREMVFEWLCGSVVAAATSDESGRFAVSGVHPGKYCIEFTEGSESEGPNRPMHYRFLIDVESKATYRSVTADITPLWPDCSGGGKIMYADELGPQSKN